ncbi:C1 family peptidase [Streptomyces sp. NPDC048208]|uniref:C1 family peptidase n=1 Tax=Streptomyces sp. NPDC048208 TaxID=3365515 RepID=UPI003711096C
MFVHRYDPVDTRLGRHVRHDPRSLAYAAPVLPAAAIQSVLWQRRTPILNQGNLGSCTGNALAGVLGTDSAGRTATGTVTVTADPYGVFAAGTYALDEAFAVKAYSLNTRLDSFAGTYPPTDAGSSGLAAGASGKALGLLTGYSHAFSLDALKSALQTGPVMWGTLWLNSMYQTDVNGFLVVDKTSPSAGGHELVISGYDVAEDAFTVQNSWGTSWGVNGLARVHGADMTWLLAQHGDVTVPAFAVAPAPAANPDKTLCDAFKTWATARGLAL